MDDHVWTMADLRARNPQLAKAIDRARRRDDANRIRDAAAAAQHAPADETPETTQDPLAAVANIPDDDLSWR